MQSPFRNWSLRSRLTLGIVLLTALGYFAASLLTQSLLKGYLTSEIDKQITAIAEGTLPRIERAGIAHETSEVSSGGGDDEQLAAPAVNPAPLSRIPTSSSVTLLDPRGNVVGGLGGDLNSASVTRYLTGLLPEEVAAHGDKPFTIDALRLL